MDLISLAARRGWIDEPSTRTRLAGREPTAQLLVDSGLLTAGQIDELAAQQYGKYVRLREIGRGGFGSVWEAWDGELSRRVAVKFLHGHEPEDLERFKREARAAARLSHPNIVRTFDVGEARGEPFIVMEYIDGVPASEAAPGVRVAAELIRQVADAVHHAHERGVIHRDLKPQNILVADGVAKVMDFGLAKSLSGEKSLSMTGDVMGTPAYMAPEQALGRIRQIDARTDVWGLGATLYSLCAGRGPFHAPNLEVYEHLRRVIEEEPAPLDATIDRDVRTIVLKCLEKDPARRYPTAQALAQDLGRFLAGEPIEAHPPGLWYRWRKRLAKRKAVVAASVLAVVALVVGGGAAVYQEVQKQKRELEVYPVVERAREQVRAVDAMTYRPSYSPAEASSRLADAEAMCREAIRIHDGYAPAYLVLGLVDMLRRRPDAAIAHLDAAIARNPAYDQAYLERARSLAERTFELESRTAVRLMTDKIALQERAWAAAALADLHRVRLDRLQPEERLYVELLEKMLASEADLAAIRAAIERAKSERRADERFWAVAAEAEHRHGDIFLAASHLRRYLDVRVGDAHGWARLAHFLNDASEPERALEAADLAVSLDPDVASSYAERGAARERISADLMRSGRVADARALADSALGDIERALSMRPDDLASVVVRGSLRFERGRLLSTLGRPEESDAQFAAALEDYDRAIAADDRAWWAIRNRALVRGRLGDVDGGIADAARAIEMAPGDVDALLNHAIVLDRRATRRDDAGEPDAARADRLAALADLEAANRMDPRDVDVLIERGTQHRVVGDYDRAEADFTAALAIQPDQVSGYTNRGIARRLKGDYAGALEDYDRALEFGEGYPDVFVNRGIVLNVLGRYEEALGDYGRALALDPECIEAVLNRGIAREDHGEIDGALADYTLAVEIDPAFAEAYNNRGLLRAAHKGDLDGAIEDFRKALEVASPGWRYRSMVEETLRRAEAMRERGADF